MKKFSLIAFAVCLSLQGCMQHESIAHEHRPHDWGTLVSQTHNF
ncbi:TPA: protein tyrosine phosphatase, partial [Acinetobacter baumannii]|nr:protein tyrosine phosphatase [Acinetobacter baumannii]